MNSVIIFCVLFGIVFAAPPSHYNNNNIDNDQSANILRYNVDNVGFGGYNYNYETSNGISQQEQGQVQNEGSENEELVVSGEYSYTAPDGNIIKVVYTADRDGFHPVGDHLPVPVAPQYV